MRQCRWLCVVALIAHVPAARAHPVPKSNHDRTIVVHLEKTASTKPGHLDVRIDYRLEVDETTVLLEDMLPFKDDVDITKYRGKPLDYYAEFMRIYAPILGNNLAAKLNGQPLRFHNTAAERTPRLVDETGQPLGHLRCEFTFRAEAPVLAEEDNTLQFREGNYLLQEGVILVSFANDADVKVARLHAPDEALQKRAPTELTPGDDNTLREILVDFRPGDRTPLQPEPTPTQAEPNGKERPANEQTASALFSDDDSLIWLMAGDSSFWLKMLLAAVFGAAHALTPGHGKTLVAAYLIGQRGTVWHALVLGIVTTLTHTGAVLLLAGILFFLPETRVAQTMQQGLGLAAGLMVVCLGMWLLLQRLSGRADHVHVGGGHEHAHGHSHSHGFDLAAAQATGVRWWGLVVLGITGGLVPCWDAIILLLYFVGRGEFLIVLPALVCFSAGLAGVLVLIGVLVVQVPRFTKSRLGEGRLVHVLPLLSAVVIVAMGLWLCFKVVRTG